MKKTYLLLALVFVFLKVSAQAQCIPDTTIHHTYISNLPDGIANDVYDQTIQFRFPIDTNIPPLSIHIDSVKIYQVVGLPYSFNYQCNKKSRTYKSEKMGA